MYVTRSLSYYMSFPEALSSPPEGPNSGYLVIQDEESETYSCFGLRKNRYLVQLPFPQNKVLTTERIRPAGTYYYPSFKSEVVFIPVINQSLSSNRYYAIKIQESYEREAFACPRKEDVTTGSCNCKCHVKQRLLNPRDVYQHFRISEFGIGCCQGKGSFYAHSLTPDAFPHDFVTIQDWQIYTKTPKNYELHEAKGINVALRARLPELNFSPSTKTSDYVVVGKWYCPFMFVKEGRFDDQIKNSLFYEMTLEQKWEQVFEHENENSNKVSIVSVKAMFLSEAVFIGDNEREATWDKRNVVDGAIWFTGVGGDNEKEESVGLNLEIYQRMRWEEENVGWVRGGKKRMLSVTREEKFEGIGGWKRFGCYVLVERFVLKRMDGSLVLAYEFGHTHQIRSIFK